MEGVKTGIEEVLGTQYLLNTPMGFHAIPRIPIGKTRKERERQREKVGNFGFLVSENIFHDIYIR
jgi:hypothetical protein